MDFITKNRGPGMASAKSTGGGVGSLAIAINSSAISGPQKQKINKYASLYNHSPFSPPH
jgi:mevalonate kinase